MEFYLVKALKFNVNELTASTLNITDQVFQDGILKSVEFGEAALIPFTDVDGNPIPSANIIIEAGAQINTQNTGRVLIVAPNIENNGIIKTPDGQTILAAGQKVYLQASDDPNLRGLFVEVDSGGTVTNTGDIVTERGNSTLVGLAINQDGRITSTTSVDANGSIRLLARDTVNEISTSNPTLDSTQTGYVSLGEESITTVLVEDTESIRDVLDDETILELFGEEGDDVSTILANLNSDEKAIDAQEQIKSNVEIVGKTIHLQEDSLISAKGGNVFLSAVTNPFVTKTVGTTQRNDEIRIQLESGSKIDVSGNAESLSMDRNELVVELRGNEFADKPIQRNGNLRGKQVTFDLREADNIELANVSGAVANIQKNVAERTSKAGDISINSEGSVRLLQGSVLDVSGGTITYQTGELSTTLLSQGTNIIDINNASSLVEYDGVFGDNIRIVEGYVDGQDAGTIDIAGYGMIVDGEFLGKTVIGSNQLLRNDIPKSGKLVLGLSNGQSDFRAPNISLQDMNLIDTLSGLDIHIDQSFTEAGLGDYRNELLLALDFIDQGGFTDIEISSNGVIRLTQGKALQLNDGSNVSLRADYIDIDRNISGASANLNFISRGNSGANNVNTTGLRGISIADNTTLDVSGKWINNFPLVSGLAIPTSPSYVNAGSISLETTQANSVFRIR